MATPEFLNPTDTFAHRHLGPTDADVREMLALLGLKSLQALTDVTVPRDILLNQALDLPHQRGEQEVLRELRDLAAENRLYRSYVGMGYYDCITPGVIQRNILENPGWYTQYTPYQAEIAQGRLEALVNLQTMVGDLTGLPLANASLLDEATAAAEAMAMCLAIAIRRVENHPSPEQSIPPGSIARSRTGGLRWPSSKTVRGRESLLPRRRQRLPPNHRW